jgi:hypothetical protein
MAKRKVILGGREVTAKDVPFEPERENWNTYLLQDGTTLKLKTVLAEVLRAAGRSAEGTSVPENDAMAS